MQLENFPELRKQKKRVHRRVKNLPLCLQLVIGIHYPSKCYNRTKYTIGYISDCLTDI